MMQSVDLIWPEQKRNKVYEKIFRRCCLCFWLFVCLSGFFSNCFIQRVTKEFIFPSKKKRTKFRYETQTAQWEENEKEKKRSKKTEFPKN